MFKAVYEELRYLKKVRNQSDFAEKLGYGKSYVSDLMADNEELPKKVQKKLTEVFEVQPQYFVSRNKNDMFPLEDNTSIVSEPEIGLTKGKNKEVIPLGKHTPLRLSADEYGEAFGDWKGLPMYNMPITASFVETYRDETVYQPQYYLHDPRFRDCDFGAIITGDSMHSEIRHGDFIACKEIKDKRFIVFGDIYYVVATNGLETCKYLNVDTEHKDSYMLIAKNANISPSPIPKDMILRLYKVRGIIRGY